MVMPRRGPLSCVVPRGRGNCLPGSRPSPERASGPDENLGESLMASGDLGSSLGVARTFPETFGKALSTHLPVGLSFPPVAFRLF